MNCVSSLIVRLLLTSLVLVSATRDQTFSAADIDEILSDFEGYAYEKDATALRTIESIVRHTQTRRDLIPHVEQRMLKLLEADATRAAKRFICQQLWIIGSARSVPTLEKMLYDARTFEMACYALRSNRSEQAAEALRRALGQVDSKDKITIINTLGDRRDEPSASALIGLLSSSNPDIVESAAAALGKIGTVETGQALRQARQAAGPNTKPALTRAYLQCAQMLLSKPDKGQAMAIYDELLSVKESELTRRSAILGMMHIGGPEALTRVQSVLRGDDRASKLTVLSNSHLLEGKRAGRYLITVLQTLAPVEQTLLINALAKRPDPQVWPAIVSMADSPNEQVRLTVLRAIGERGNASSVKFLAGAVSRGSEHEKRIASASLRTIKGRSVDEAILEAMKSSGSASRPELIRVLSDRQVIAAVPDLLEEASNAEVDVRRAAFKAVGRLAGPEELPRITANFVEHYDQAVRTDAERAIIAVAKRISDENQRAAAVLDVLKREERTAVKCSLLRILGGIANREALLALESTLASSDSEQRNTAMRELAAWPSADALP
ncbi:MAG: HEAT repeat domain-containing protein, partial [Planctomycetota bacterium]